VTEQVKPAFPILQQLIHSQDEKIISVACWALADLSSDGYGHMQAVIESGAFPQLVELLM
jgi:importin subunit alpha-6/7